MPSGAPSRDPFAVVERRDDPLASKNRISRARLASSPWVIARHGTPIHTRFEEFFDTHGALPNQHRGVKLAGPDSGRLAQFGQVDDSLRSPDSIRGRKADSTILSSSDIEWHPSSTRMRLGSNLNESGRSCDGSPWARRRNARASIAFRRGWSQRRRRERRCSRYLPR